MSQDYSIFLVMSSVMWLVRVLLDIPVVVLMFVNVQVRVSLSADECPRDLLHRLIDLEGELLVGIAEGFENLEEVGYAGDFEVRPVEELVV